MTGLNEQQLAELKAKAAEILAKARAFKAANPAAFVKPVPSKPAASDGFETAMDDIARKYQK